MYTNVVSATGAPTTARAVLGAVLALLILFVPACDRSTGIQLRGGNGGDFQVTVSGGTTPTYSWNGAAATSLLVVEGATNEPVWNLSALDTDVGFQPPVDHGVVPEGARQQEPAGVLQDGTIYRVTVTTVENTSGEREFTP